MSNSLPQYQKSVGIEVTGTSDAQGAFGALASATGQEGRVVTGIATNEIKQLNQAEQMEKHAQITSGLEQIREDTLDPKNFNNQAVESYDAKAKGFANGILETTSRHNKAYVKNLLQYSVEQNRVPVANRVNTLTKNQGQAQFLEYYNNAMKDTTAAYFNGNVTADDKGKMVNKGDVLAGDMNRKIQTALDSGLITGGAAATLQNNAHDQFEQQSYLGQFNDALHAGKPQDWIEKFNKNKTIDPITRAKIQPKVMSMLHTYEQNNHLDRASMQLSMSNSLLRLQQGANRADISAVETKIQQFYPQAYPGFKAKADAAEIYGTISTQSKYVPYNKGIELANSLKPKADDPEYAVKYEAWANAIQAIKTNYNAAMKDSAVYVMGAPSVRKAAENRLTSASDGEGKLLNTASKGEGDVHTAMLMQEKIQGLPPALLPNQVAASFVSKITQLPLDKQMEQLNTFVAAHATKVVSKDGGYQTVIDPKYTNIVMRDLSKAKLPIANQTLLSMQTNAQSRPDVPLLMDALQTGKAKMEQNLPNGISASDIKEEVKENLEDYMSSFNSYSGASQSTLNNVMSTAYMLALAKVHGRHEDVDSASEGAVNSVVNNFYDYMSTRRSNVRLPKGFDHNLVKYGGLSLVDQANKADLKVDPLMHGIDPNMDPKQQQDDYKDQLASTSSLVTTPDNQGIILVNANGTPVKDADGNTFTMSFSDMANPSSHARSQITQAQADVNQMSDEEQITAGISEFDLLKKGISSDLKGIKSVIKGAGHVLFPF